MTAADPERLAEAEKWLRGALTTIPAANATVVVKNDLRLLLAEYDRRGAAIDELSARLAVAERERDRLADLAYDASLGREPDDLDLGRP